VTDLTWSMCSLPKRLALELYCPLRFCYG
jgi:hypothetical protein